MYDRHYDGKLLKPYKGYGIEKSWLVINDKKIPNTTLYAGINLDEEEYVTEYCKTIKEVHKEIDLLYCTEE